GNPFIAFNIIQSNGNTCLGGGVSINNSSSAIVTHNVIRGNWTDSYHMEWGGGGLYMTCGTVTNIIGVYP
ncbi:MAG: hypothetical protein ABIK30_12880, partial [bacterium]